MQPPDEAPTLVQPAKDPNDGEDVRHDELARARNFAGGSAVIAVIGIIAQWTNVPRGWGGIASRITVIVLAFHSVVIWYQSAIQKRYSRGWVTAFGVVAVLCGVTVQIDVGVFSPVVAVAVLGMAFFGRARNTRVIWALASIYIVGFVLSAGLISLDVIPDTSAFSPKGATRWQKLSLTIMIGTLLVTSLLHGRVSRRAAMESLELARAAAIEAHRREAQLQEAQRELEQALGPGAGRPGRCTGLVADDWEIGPLIGRGGMGEVYAARHRADGKDAALKVLNAQTVDDPVIEARFRREARIAMGLRAPNLVAVYGVGLTPLGTPYIAMELLRGSDLGWHLRRDDRFELARLVEMADEVAAGLEVAHEAGVVHRDLKPQNVFLAERDGASARWKVLDFGISTLETSQGTLTADRLVGTPAYMSPEQADGSPVTRRSDIFSFGGVLYRALTGAPPFSGASAPQLLYAVVHDMPVRPRDLVPALPADVEAVLAIALAKDPNERFDAAPALATALRAAATGTLPAPLRKRALLLLAARPWQRVKAS